MRIAALMLIGIVLASACAKQEGDVYAEVNFIKSDFKRLAYLNDSQKNFMQNITPGSITVKDIRNYTEFKPTIEKNGFQFENFQKDTAVSNLLHSLSNAISMGYDDVQRTGIIKPEVRAFENHMKTWGSINVPSIAFSEVICGKGVYRNTDLYKSAVADGDSQFEFAHIDFYPGQDLLNLFKLLGFDSDLVQRFGVDAANSNFWQNHKLVKMLNIWMPLKKVKAYPLAVVDISTLNFDDDIVPTLSNVKGVPGKVQIGALKQNNNLQFYYKSGLERGEAIVFDSNRTPHTAFKLPGQSDERESFEIRCAYIQTLGG